MATDTEIQEIEKEQLDGCEFPSQEVLEDPGAIAERRKMLERATSMGNTEQTKFKIVFQDDEAVKKVETTIWATGDKNISLKHGKTIPIHRIREVRIV